MLQFIIIYFAVQLINVMFNTVRLIFTVKAPKATASLFTAISYAIYTVVLVYTASDFDMWVKVAIAFTTNAIGVYVSMTILDKFKRDKVWKVEAIGKLDSIQVNAIRLTLKNLELSYTLSEADDLCVVTAYTDTQKQSHDLRIALSKYDMRFIAFEENARL